MSILNIWEMGTELDANKPAGSKFTIPTFVKGKYMVLKVAPPKTKTIRDGLVMTAAMLSYEYEGAEVKTIEVKEGVGGYDILFPHGKYDLLATKYRGPKSMYKFLNPKTGKFTQISNDKFTLTYAEQYLSSILPNWYELDASEKDVHVDEYFENMYTFGMANDFNFNTGIDPYDIPAPGMVVNFYRRWTAPKEGEKYGNTIITKWPNKKSEVEKDYQNLDGSFAKFDEAIALAIYDGIKEQATPKFDPSSFVELEDGEDDDSVF
jgi:hypothetical protein